MDTFVPSPEERASFLCFHSLPSLALALPSHLPCLVPVAGASNYCFAQATRHKSKNTLSKYVFKLQQSNYLNSSVHATIADFVLYQLHFWQTGKNQT